MFYVSVLVRDAITTRFVFRSSLFGEDDDEDDDFDFVLKKSTPTVSKTVTSERKKSDSDDDVSKERLTLIFQVQENISASY